jgi:hypothetical protein
MLVFYVITNYAEPNFWSRRTVSHQEGDHEALNITDGTLNYWSRMFPDFPLVRLPGSNRYRRTEVEAWIASHPKRVGNNKRGLVQKKKEVQPDTI